MAEQRQSRTEPAAIASVLAGVASMFMWYALVAIGTTNFNVGMHKLVLGLIVIPFGMFGLSAFLFYMGFSRYGNPVGGGQNV